MTKQTPKSDTPQNVKNAILCVQAAQKFCKLVASSGNPTVKQAAYGWAIAADIAALAAIKKAEQKPMV